MAVASLEATGDGSAKEEGPRKGCKNKKQVSTQHQRKPFLLILHVAKRFCSCRVPSPTSTPKFGRFQGACPVLHTASRRSHYEEVSLSSLQQDVSRHLIQSFTRSFTRASRVFPQKGARPFQQDHFNKFLLQLRNNQPTNCTTL